MAHVNVMTAGQLERFRAKVRAVLEAPVFKAVPVQQEANATPMLQVATVSDETRKEEERLRLKTLSEERASKWPNTLQVQHWQHSHPCSSATVCPI
jgi:hypothetical protein